MKEQETNTLTNTLDEQQVVEYLKANPNFFVKHEHLLDSLKVPHKSGAAISLGERQVQVFREHRDQLKQQLNELISVAHENDAHFAKSKRLLLNLLEVKSLDEINIVINQAFKDDENIDFSRILLFGEVSDYPVSEIDVIRLDHAHERLGDIMVQTHALCGQFSEEIIACLFPHNKEEISSAAIIPIRNGEILGVFCLGSKDGNYFNDSMGSLFLSYISDFISRILPNLLEASKRHKVEEHVPSLLE